MKIRSALLMLLTAATLSLRAVSQAPASTTQMPPAARPATAPAAPAAGTPATAPRRAPSQTAAAAGGGPGLVWVNTASKVYHCPGTAFYGKTKAGKYLAEDAAKAEGDRANGGKLCSK